MGKKSKKGQITLVWHNGQITTGDTWREVEDNIRATQWNAYNTRHEFREDMRKRAYVWSRTKIGLAHSPREFIEQLAGAGMFLIAREEEG